MPLTFPPDRAALVAEATALRLDLAKALSNPPVQQRDQVYLYARAGRTLARMDKLIADALDSPDPGLEGLREAEKSFELIREASLKDRAGWDAASAVHSIAFCALRDLRARLAQTSGRLEQPSPYDQGQSVTNIEGSAGAEASAPTLRVCPHSDAICRHGMTCPYSCATGSYNGEKFLAQTGEKP